MTEMPAKETPEEPPAEAREAALRRLPAAAVKPSRSWSGRMNWYVLRWRPRTASAKSERVKIEQRERAGACWFTQRERIRGGSARVVHRSSTPAACSSK